jgi:hypothetical protein
MHNHPSQPATQEHQMNLPRYTFKDFLPLIIILGIVIGFTLVRQWISGWNVQSAMNDFMAGFFLLFGGFKILNLHGFAEAYSMYDIIAKRSTVYAYAYPFIEISLGIAYLLRLYPTPVNVITLVVMLVSSIGVAQELAQRKTITCACLGAVFKIPMTYVTLLEDVLMAAMALIMLIL